MIITIPYAPRRVFIPYHTRTQRWAALTAHRRCGKTVACVNDIVARALSIKRPGPPPRYAYVAPYLAQAKEVAWGYLKASTLPALKDKNESELWVELVNGARIRIHGADNPDRLRGSFLDGVILDEYADMRPTVWGEVIRPMLMDYAGWATFIGTPKGRNEFYDLMERAKADPDWYSAVLKASETGILSEAELADTTKDMTPEQVAQELECSFDAAITGAYYGRDIADMERAGRVGDVPLQPDLPVYTAWDLGIGDATAIWFFQVVGNDIHIIDHYEAHGHGLPHYAAVLHSKGYPYARHYVPHDARARDLGTGRTRVETMKTLLGRLPDVLGQNDVMDGINAARLTIPRCRFDATKTRDGLEALRQYRADFDDKTKAFKDRPRHDWTSHCFAGDTKLLTRNGMHAIMDLPETGEVLTPCGWKAYRNPRIARTDAPLVEVRFVGGHTVRCTPDHLFLTVSGWKSVGSLPKGSLIQSSLTPSRSISLAAFIACGRLISTTRAAANAFTGMSGWLLSGLSQRLATSTTRTATRPTTGSPTWSAWTRPNTTRSPGPIAEATASLTNTSTKLPVMVQRLGIGLRKAASGIAATLSGLRGGLNGAASLVPVLRAGSSSAPLSERADTVAYIAARTAKPLVLESVVPLNERADVWDITVPGVECFSLANGAVVHNSADAFRYLSMAWRSLKPVAPPPVPTFDFGISGAPGMPFKTGVSVTELIRRAERRARDDD